MSASFSIDSRELVKEIEALGETVAAETDRIVESNAQLFAADLPSRYPAIDGDLRQGVSFKKIADRVYRVASRAKHAHLFEFGTVRRFTAQTGASRGTMPAKPTFVPWAVKARARMLDQVKTYLRSVRAKGFTGTPEVRES